MADESHTNHDKYYAKLKEDVESMILSMFETHGVSLSKVVGKDAVETPDDLCKALEFVFAKGSCSDSAKASMLAAEWLQSYHELKEHKEVSNG